jgi:hypothetical protein
MSFASVAIAAAPFEGLLSRFSTAVRGWLARHAEHRRREIVGRSLLKSGDREMVELGRQILGGRPLTEIFGDP